MIQGVAQFETMGQHQVRYGVSATDFTEGERAILAKYRQLDVRVRPCHC